MTRRPHRADREPLIANARPDFADLSPVSEVPADTTRANWSALLPGQDVPLIWEDDRHDPENPRG